MLFLLFCNSQNRNSNVSSIRSAKAISENEIVESLPVEPLKRRHRLYDLATNALSNFIHTHALQVRFPKKLSEEMADAIEEGRGKMKKYFLPMLLIFGAKFSILVTTFLFGLIFMSVKALTISKIAFVLAASIIGLQKFGSGSNLEWFASLMNGGNINNTPSAYPQSYSSFNSGPQSGGWTTTNSITPHPQYG